MIIILKVQRGLSEEGLLRKHIIPWSTAAWVPGTRGLRRRKSAIPTKALQPITTDISCSVVWISRFAEVPVWIDHADGVQIWHLQVEHVEVARPELIVCQVGTRVFVGAAGVGVHRMMELGDVDLGVVLVSTVAVVE